MVLDGHYARRHVRLTARGHVSFKSNFLASFPEEILDSGCVRLDADL